MSDSNALDRQAIINQVHHHFIVQRSPAGRLSDASCIDQGHDGNNRPVSCDQEPDELSHIFGQSELTISDIEFLSGVHDEHDMAVKNAARSDSDLDTYFLEELAHRLDRFANEQGLDSPCTPKDLGAA